MNFVSQKTLIAYFSHSGNTQTLAKIIQGHTGGDLFAIEPQNPYPTHYDTVVAQAKKESESGYLPPIGPLPKNLGAYDVVFIGSPVWWYTVAPPVLTFAQSPELAGKIIIPFVTHEGGGASNSYGDIKKNQPAANVREGFAFYGSRVAGAGQEAARWLEKL